MPHFRRKPSSRRAAKPTASWLVTGLTIANEIKYGRRTTHIIPCKPSHHRRRFHAGQRLSVRAYVGGPTECHVTVTNAQRVQLRDVDYPVVRELGYVRVDDFRVAWVAEHDQGEYAESCILERFDRRHAHKEVWLLRFDLDRTDAGGLLAARSEEGYTDNVARAVREEMPAVRGDQWELHIGRPARDREHERQRMLHADRASQSNAARVAQARDAASVKGLDMRSEFRRYERLMLHGRTGDAVRQLELIESRVFPSRAAA